MRFTRWDAWWCGNFCAAALYSIADHNSAFAWLFGVVAAESIARAIAAYWDEGLYR